MNELFLKLKGSVVMVAFASALVTSTMVASADLIVPSTPSNVYSNVPLPSTIGPSTAASLTNQIFITPGRGCAIEATFVGTNTTTSNMVFRVGVTMDGTNWAVPAPILITIPLAATVTNRVYTNFGSVYFESARNARIESWSNSDAVGTITPIRLLFGRAQQGR